MPNHDQIATPQANGQIQDVILEEIQTEHSSAQEPDNVSTLRQTIASAIGVEETRIAIINDAATILSKMQEGVIVSLHIGGTRRFWKQLTPKDLGLEGDDTAQSVLGDQATKVITDYFQLGKLSLLPRERQIAHLPDDERDKFVSYEDFENFDRNARNVLYRHSIASHWGRFVPVTSFKAWQAKNKEWEDDFKDLKQRLLDNYDAIIEFVVAQYRPLALETWRSVSVNMSLRRSESETISEALIREISLLLAQGKGRETFVENYLNRIREAFKSRDTVESQFRYEAELSIVPLPSLVAADKEHADRIYQERTLRDKQVEAELKRIEEQRRIEQAQSWSAEQEAREKRRLALQAEQARLALQKEMEEEVLKSAREQKQRLVTQFYRDVVGQINDQLQLICSEVLGNIETHKGTLRGPNSKQLKDLVSRLETLNFMGNTDIARMLDAIRGALPTKEESEKAGKGLAKIDTTKLQTVLRSVSEQAKVVVIDLGMVPSVRKARADDVLPEGLPDFEKRQKRSGGVLAATAPQSKPGKKGRENPLS